MSNQILSTKSLLFPLLTLSMLTSHAADHLIGNPDAEVRGDFRIESEEADASKNYGVTTRFVDASSNNPATIDVFSTRTENVWTWWSGYQDDDPPSGILHMQLDSTGSLLLYDVNAGTNTAVIEFDTINKEIRVDGRKLLATSGADVDGVSFGGTVNYTDDGTSIPASGQGTRMMWYPEMAAFRSGYVTGDAWDADHIGLYSTALGFDVEASGVASIALGALTKTTGFLSIAIGSNHLASEYATTTVGGIMNSAESEFTSIFGGVQNRVADEESDSSFHSVILGGSKNLIQPGQYSTIIGGNSNIIQADYALVLGGRNNSAKGENSLAGGRASTTAGSFAFAFGDAVSADGLGAVAWGGHAQALGNYSMALGYHVESAGPYSVAFGNFSQSTGSSSVAFGGARATGNYSLAMGDIGEMDNGESMKSIAAGDFSFSFGSLNQANGDFSIALGEESKTSGGYSLASGYQSEAEGYYSFAFGALCKAQGWASMAVGIYATASKPFSQAFGQGVNANAFNTLAIGRYNVGYYDGQGDAYDTGPLFEIGNGSGDSAIFRSNALTTSKNGKTTLTNKYWVADDISNPNADDGNALVVEGNTVLKGKLTLQRHGDIFMGHFGLGEDQGF